MKKNFLKISSLLAFVALATSAFAATVTDDSLKLGQGSDDKTIVFDKGSGAANPRIKWNNSTSKIQLANDGTSFGNVVTSFIGATANVRLTLESGVPISTTDQTAKTSVYVTPYKGNNIAFYSGTVWEPITFTEQTISVAATTNTIYDVFCRNNSGTIACDTTAWTNDTTRATALALQDGIYVKSGDTSRRYIGSYRTTAVSGQTEDSLKRRLVWNNYNRVIRRFSVVDTTDSWSYSTAAYRQANASTANQVDQVTGLSEEVLSLETLQFVNTSGATPRNGYPGIGVGSTTVNSAQHMSTASITSSIAQTVFAKYQAIPAVGYQFFTWLEYGGGADTQTWFGDNGATLLQSGMFGRTTN